LKGSEVLTDTRTRKWQITINNPEAHGFTREYTQEVLHSFKGLEYFCMADEKGKEEETPHRHIYVYFRNAVKFSQLQNKFTKKAHLEMCRGTSQENKDYVFKEGKHANDPGHDYESHVEYGIMPIERPGARNDINSDLKDMIAQGMTNMEIITELPNMIQKIKTIEEARNEIIYSAYRETWRDVDVTYIYGPPRTGKTRGVTDTYGYKNVHRVTDYDNPFDSYRGQDVIVFDEFESNLKITHMNALIEGHPVELKCRYFNKWACYHKVYIISNTPLEDQYKNVQEAEKGQIRKWRAFLARIKTYRIYLAEGFYRDCEPGIEPNKHEVEPMPWEWIEDIEEQKRKHVSMQQGKL
jgi:hypothetical protein